MQRALERLKERAIRDVSMDRSDFMKEGRSIVKKMSGYSYSKGKTNTVLMRMWPLVVYGKLQKEAETYSKRINLGDITVDEAEKRYDTYPPNDYEAMFDTGYGKRIHKGDYIVKLLEDKGYRTKE